MPVRVASTFLSPSFQGRELSPSHNKNLIINEFSLVIQRVDRSSAGAYVCEATNSAGKGSSDQVPLTIKCKKRIKTPYFCSWPNTKIFDELKFLFSDIPVCASSSGKGIYVGKNEDAKIICNVTANPTPDGYL